MTTNVKVPDRGTTAASDPRPARGGEREVRTTCPYCGVGCGVLATRQTDRTTTVAGDPEHPANFGRLCSKGAALGETLSLEDRLLHPIVDGTRASWEQALNLVAHRFSDAIAEHGPDSVAFYGSGQMLTEDYYAANKLMKGFIGTANIDTNSRLCMASSVAGHKRAFGSDTVPACYEDLELADLVVLVGSNLAWCHPVLYQRLAAAKERRRLPKIVVIDPRDTATCEIADLHLPLMPGSDVALFNGLLTHIDGASAIDRRYTGQHTAGLDEALRTARALSTAQIARLTDLSRLDLFRFYDLFVSTERVVTVYSQGVNQSTAGTDKVNAIINCHLATGRIGRPGMGPLSATGQPNAMGGREVGGLANMLAAHLELGDPEHRRIVQDFWNAPRIADKPGLKAVDLFRAVDRGQIKAIWIMATNPVDSVPEANAVRSALGRCPFVVVSDVVRETDTTALAHVLLPALAWGEKDGTVTNSERRISRQRAFLPAPGEARSDWWQIAEVARRMGFAEQFAWSGPAEILTEHARLTTVENHGQRDLHLGELAKLTPAEYDDLQPLQWPHGRKRFFGDGRFFTSDLKARFVSTPVRAPAGQTDAAFPLLLNTGRIRDQWHTMTRTAKAARLMSHIAEPFVEVHPDDAQRYNLAPACLATISSTLGSAILRVVVTPRIRPGSVFAPMHWTDRLTSMGRVDALIAGNVDPVSGQPELKAMPVAMTPFAAAWHAFAVSRAEPNLAPTEYWAKSRAAAGWRIELAGAGPFADIEHRLRTILGLTGTGDLLVYHDAATGQQRMAAFDGDRLVAALFVAPHPVAVSRTWAAAQLGARFADPHARLAVLAGRPGTADGDKGAIVCACFEVGRNQIIAAMRKGCGTVADVGATTSAGTNCGSCRAEIGRLIDANPIQKAG